MTPICATFSEFRLVKGRKVYQIVCELPFEQADAALAALGGLPNPHAERWVGIVALKEQPTGQAIVGSAPPVADAADSPAAAQDGGSTEGRASLGPGAGLLRVPQAQARGAAEPAAKPKKRWEDYSPSQQAGMACERGNFADWCNFKAPQSRWDKRDLRNDELPATWIDDWPRSYVRWYCGVSSRSELDTNPEAAKRWRELYGMFQADTQYGDRR